MVYIPYGVKSILRDRQSWLWRLLPFALGALCVKKFLLADPDRSSSPQLDWLNQSSFLMTPYARPVCSAASDPRRRGFVVAGVGDPGLFESPLTGTDSCLNILTLKLSKLMRVKRLSLIKKGGVVNKNVLEEIYLHWRPDAHHRDCPRLRP
jgi:hypothetical protein